MTVGRSLSLASAATIAMILSSIRTVASYLQLLEPPMIRFTSMADRENIWLQPGTRVHMLVYKDGKWQVWTSTNTRSGDSDLWCGTYMELHPNGMCIQCTRTEAYVNNIVVRPATGDAT